MIEQPETAAGGAAEEEITTPEEEQNGRGNGNVAEELATILRDGVEVVVTHFDCDVDGIVAAALIVRQTGAIVEFRSANEGVEADEVGVVGVDVKDAERSFKGVDENGERGSAAWLVAQALALLGIALSEAEAALVNIADEVDRAVRRNVSYGFLHLMNGLKDLGVSDCALIDLTVAIMGSDGDALQALVNDLVAGVRTGPCQEKIQFGTNPESELSAAVALASCDLRAQLVLNANYGGVLARRSDHSTVHARRSNLDRDLRTALRDGGTSASPSRRWRMIDAIVDEVGEVQTLLAFAPAKTRVRLLALALLGPSRVAPAERRSRARMYAAIEELGQDEVLVINDIERPRATKGAKRLRQVREAGVLFVVRHGRDGSSRVDPTVLGEAWLDQRGLAFKDFANAILPDIFHSEAWGAVCGSTKAWRTPPEHDHGAVSAALRWGIQAIDEHVGVVD